MTGFNTCSGMNVITSNLKVAMSVPQIRGFKVDAFPAFHVI